ncbi:cation:proton antiporter [Parvibaculum sp.]|uniref:cation:proton antiporter n=1 Tax=Parvibaculum sp. TaxID=2024848 RepID=UPI002717646F|nr:cation:proton antiporter [Parvibaculum sp.]MDO9125685.1 cation:proton antiporter [Parvibaculum sp.]MDP1626546.1 cation:proton antiporter [Parvibaculum sp.]MDP2150468.1 cation:proton antiporter [Parvibaculum sp.]MDP3327688.1 cation:proton antiporter [Parvibaculum sp.]
MHDVLTLNSVTLLIVIALACGFALIRLRQPAIVGYILAGVVLGPGGLGLVRSAEGIDLFAELGVLLLLFLIGLELSLKTFRNVFRIALLCAGLQSLVAIGLTWGAGELLGWSFERSLVLGFVLSLSSTAVGIKMLSEIGELRTNAGRVTMGVLIAQDLLIIPMLVIVQSLGSAQGVGIDIWLAFKLIAAIGILAGVAVLLSRRERLVLPWSRYLRNQPDLAPLAAIAFCFVFAAGSGYLGLSPSYGAFLAGLILGASTDRRAAIFFTSPVQSILLMVFFLSIGLLIDLAFIVENLWIVLLLVFVILVAKTASNIAILYFLRVPWEDAFIAGLVMAQVGEFSFVLAKAGLGAGAIDRESYQLALSVIALSLIVSPFWLVTARRIHSLGHTMQYTGIGPVFQRIYPNAYEWSRRGRAFALENAAALLHWLRSRR